MPDAALSAGFKAGAKGVHSSRTLMLPDIAAVLSATPPTAARADYATAIVEDNCLGKATAATRKLSFQRLSELYGLDPDIQLFRVFRALWHGTQEHRELLALLIGLARDPLLAVSAGAIQRLAPGDELQRDRVHAALVELTGDRFNASTLDKIVRNVSSSWTQSGHLAGRTFKRRQRVDATAFTTAFALLLANLTGFRGVATFSSAWFAYADQR